ncbi:bifunctional phosphopantothenoylcysteine decarboxylase/phosphopantothenate synthase [Pacificimonas flava]|uniref:Coenzyme A biosynthesis bifunctional protein CoaBC n=2 Tax=Pacificimonas TaxID=1960290 RepID=A0A219B3A6_9SPHN|nr:MULTISPECIES: bifunctional phosphopantothenoylcysteine decarboxylase/phosphopantothenate--cysteine ligase CoaBC [Pacificimonas]MBZ6377470.1 bifunctional phosphopantothenoylcysteine decarboxylase/phosphopantothenate--cysteine ligase CoaBC [Pacificimonas aurantium]OWV32830.1 bifunctional phosphopantothenoylcysteine decarboxylase/phosphopantothenate synthase [Pacificimonas flava]
MQGKRILLIVSGGIAAYKALELVRLLNREGAQVRAVMTESAKSFVTPLSLSVLTGDRVFGNILDATEESEIGHIQLSRDADLVVVCPATANLMAKAAQGLADDLATTLLLATDTRVLWIPAMNVRMWHHPATKRNVAQLSADGAHVMSPDEGGMACGEWGAGRLPEPPAIVDRIRSELSAETKLPPPEGARPLAGKRAVVTAGPTHEPIDPVRYIANRSSGRQGFAIAEALAALGADVTLVAGPVTLPAPRNVRRIDVESAREMRQAVEDALPADIAVMVAAVADWRVAEEAPTKLKKDGASLPPLTLAENPDILAELSMHDRRPRLVVGFAAETDNVVDHASAKLARKGCDWIVANDVSGDVMGGADNRVHLVTAGGVEDWPDLPKSEVARRLADRIAKECA